MQATMTIHKDYAPTDYIVEGNLILECKKTEIPYNYSRSGYGSHVPTGYMVRYKNKWRRVYCYIFSNSGTLFIGESIRNKHIVEIS